MEDHLVHWANAWIWGGFICFVIIALSIDTFFISEKRSPSKSATAAIIWSLIWISCALIFNVLLYIYLTWQTTDDFAKEVSLNFLTGYLIEKTLSMDNLFAFHLIFTQLKIPLKYQHRVFSIGIWSAIIMRLVLILFGMMLVNRFHWTLYLMGLFLLWTGLKVFFDKEKEPSLNQSILFKGLKKLIRLTPKFHGQRFFVRIDQYIYATPLFAALVFIEMSDLIFAFDSIPAIFSITTDPFIVWSSNIFAILGLRALYFLIANMVERFHLLKYGIAFILIFIGIKMLIVPFYKIPVGVSLSFVIGILISFIWLSVRRIKLKGNKK